MDLCTLYWSMANAAIAQGVIPPDVANIIARTGHRKGTINWTRKCIDLCGEISTRLKGGAHGDIGQPD